MKSLIVIGILAVVSVSPHHHHRQHRPLGGDPSVHPPWWHPRTPGGDRPGPGFNQFDGDSDENPFLPPGARDWNFNPWSKRTTEKPRVTFPIYPPITTNSTTTSTTAESEAGSTTSKPIGEDLVIQSCIKGCPVTPEHNPVCGSNNVTYANIGALECARMCGVDVQMKRKSRCNSAKNGNNNNNNNSNNGKNIDYAAIQACMLNCPVTSEYNPVCASGNVTYNNPGRFECAKSCGLPITLVRRTSCNAPLTIEEGIEICMRSCSVATQYNPVCGTDNRTYDNEGRLECAKNCGRNVQIRRRTSCDIPGPDVVVTTSSPSRDDKCDGTSNGNCDSRKPKPTIPTPTVPTPDGNGSDKTMTEIIACMQLCRITLEVNPICGTDGVTYANPGQLLCAQSCGVDVRVRKFAPCLGSNVTPPTPTACPTVPAVTPAPTGDDCKNKCLVSPELKPVCGTNGMTYMNIESLQCMQKCGVDVKLFKNSACGSSTSTSTSSTAATPPVWLNTDRPTQPTVPTQAPPTPNPNNQETCINTCSNSQAYQPVCGTDDITYSNLQMLQCVKRCGKNVNVKSQSACISGSKDENTTENELGFTIPEDILIGVFPHLKPSSTTSNPKDDSNESVDLDERFGVPEE